MLAAPIGLLLAACLVLTFGCEKEAHPDHDPLHNTNVSGQIVSTVGVQWLTRPERETEEQPERMLDALSLEPGMNVGDVGAGVGYHTLRIARRVGPKGHVWATDIQPRMLEMLEERVAKTELRNVTTVLSADTDTGLETGSLDLILMVGVYHELSEPEQFLTALATSLKDGGRLAIVEFRAEDEDVPVQDEDRMAADQIINELAAAGWTLHERHDFLPMQHLLIFTQTPKTTPPT